MTSFTVVKKGEEIKFDSAFADINEAKSYLLQKMSYNNFAMDLVEKKKVSATQIAWMHYLATQDVIDSQTPVEFGPYKQLVNKMYDTMTAKKFQVRLPGMTLSTVNKGPNIGCVYVFENGNYVGKITSTGDLKGNASEDVLFFFFQAEDGIRDPLVTGVKTCALPISTQIYLGLVRIRLPITIQPCCTYDVKMYICGIKSNRII